MYYYLLTSSYTNQIYYVKTEEEIRGLVRATALMRKRGEISLYASITGIIPISKERYNRERGGAVSG